MRYGLESALPINAFSPRARGPFARGMTLEGGGGGGGGGFLGSIGNAISDAASSVSDVLASVDPGPAIGSSVGNAIDNAVQNTGQFFADIDPGVKIGNLGESVGSGLSEAGHAVGSLLSNGEKYIGQTLDSTGKWVDVTTDRLGNVIVHTLHSGYDGVGTAAQNLGRVGVHLDNAVNDNVPGGWKTVAGIAATAAIPFAAPEFLAPMADIAKAAGMSALKGGALGAGTALIAGKDPVKGALTGAKMGAITGGVGELGSVLDLGSTGTKLAQTAATSLATGKNPTKNLMNTAMSIGAGQLGNEFGVNNQISQTALNAGKAIAAGKDPTKSLINTAINMGVGAGTKSFSDFFKDAINNGMTPEQAYTVASGEAESGGGGGGGGEAPTDFGGITNQTTNADGDTIFTYDDGSQMTVSKDGEVIDATESAEYNDPTEALAEYKDPGTYAADENATGEYKDPQAEPTATTGGLPSSVSKTLNSAVKSGTNALTSQVNKTLSSTISNALMPTAPKRPVSKAQQARPTYSPAPLVNTLPQTQAAATNILAGNAPAQATTGTMTPAERMAAIAKAFGGNMPALMPITSGGSSQNGAQVSPAVFASGGSTTINSEGVAVDAYGNPVATNRGYTQNYTQDYSNEFIDPQAGKYLKPGIVRGHGNYTMPGYPFGQLWRIGMAEGGEVEGHNPEFFSEGGLNSLENRYVKGDGDGTSDSIPAMLANGEFVIPADVVSGLGNGSNDSGAKVLDEFLKTIREHKQKSGTDKLPPDSKGPLGYLLEANKKVKN